MKRFADRADAGRQLAQRLQDYRGRDVLVLGLPRGGVPVAYEVAAALGAAKDGWDEVAVPSTWQVAEKTADYLGPAWFRREFHVPLVRPHP